VSSSFFRLYVKNKLDDFIRYYFETDWNIRQERDRLLATKVQYLLRRQWNSRVVQVCNIVADSDAVLSEERRVDDRDDQSTLRVCPITLCPFVFPVVASDGYVYERDALVEWICRNEMCSPMTRQVLEFNVYELYAR